MSGMGDKSDVVQDGSYVVIQRQNYMKLHKVNSKHAVMLGKDQVLLDAIIGKPSWTAFKMEPKNNSKRTYVLKECSNIEYLSEQLASEGNSGVDNRNIFDDGKSQLLSTEEIVGFRESGMSGQEIVGQLIENSMTFKNKTEYAQHKYLKKKEKKYFQYVIVRKPSVRLISEIYFKQDPGKVMNLRMDSLSQLLSLCNIHSGGNFIVYESGCHGLAVAAVLDAVGTHGRVIHIHPANIPQKQAVLAMNFSEQQRDRLCSVNVYGLIRVLKGETADAPVSENQQHDSDAEGAEMENVNASEKKASGKGVDSLLSEESEETNITIGMKRKHPDSPENEDVKRPRWEKELEEAVSCLSTTKADGLLIVSREHPANILLEFLPYIAPSRPFAVYCSVREPLLDLYLTLKGQGNVVGMRITETWLRNYQVLPSRTHPDVSMSGGGGYILSGILVENGRGKCMREENYDCR